MSKNEKVVLKQIENMKTCNNPEYKEKMLKAIEFSKKSNYKIGVYEAFWLDDITGGKF
jgi:hypothetical protein